MATKKNKVVKKTTASGTGPASKLDECLSHIAQAYGLIKSGVAPLTVVEKKHTLKLRKGGEKFIPQIAAIAKANGVEVTTHPVDVMLTNMKTAQSYAALHERTTVFLKAIEDNVMRAQSEAWQTAMLTYSMLRPLAKKDGNVGKTLAPMKAYMATGKRPPPKVTVATAPHGTGATISAAPATGTTTGATSAAATPVAEAPAAAALVTPAAAGVTQAALSSA